MSEYSKLTTPELKTAIVEAIDNTATGWQSEAKQEFADLRFAIEQGTDQEICETLWDTVFGCDTESSWDRYNNRGVRDMCDELYYKRGLKQAEEQSA